MKYDILIIGGGAAGLMSAIELSTSGKSIVILERGHIGQESSWAGGGILSPLYPWRYPDSVSDLAKWSHEHLSAYFSKLSQDTGIDSEWLQSGHLILDPYAEQNAAINWAQKYDIQLESVDSKTIAKIEPGLSEKFHSALWLPGIGQTRNPRLMRALYKQCGQRGITIHQDSPVREIVKKDNRVIGIKSTAGQILADMVLITAGAWSGSLFDDIALPPVEPVKGQMIQFLTEPGAIQRITLYQGRYVIPRKDGKILAGSTLEKTGFDKSTSEDAKLSLQADAIEMYPLLKKADVINHWAGLRPGNERNTPFICKHPDLENLYFNTGHFRNGIILGFASARLIADLMLHHPPILNPENYEFVST